MWPQHLSTIYYARVWMGGEVGGNGHMYMYGWVPLLSTWKYLNIVNQLFCCCHFIATSCLILFDPRDCSQPGFSVHAILQAWILEWVAISFSRGSSQPRDQTQVSCISGRFFSTEPPQGSQPINQLFRCCCLVAMLFSMLFCPWNFLGKNTAAGCHFLLQEISLTPI